LTAIRRLIVERQPPRRETPSDLRHRRRCCTYRTVISAPIDPDEQDAFAAAIDLALTRKWTRARYGDLFVTVASVTDLLEWTGRSSIGSTGHVLCRHHDLFALPRFDPDAPLRSVHLDTLTTMASAAIEGTAITVWGRALKEHETELSGARRRARPVGSIAGARGGSRLFTEPQNRSGPSPITSDDLAAVEATTSRSVTSTSTGSSATPRCLFYSGADAGTLAGSSGRSRDSNRGRAGAVPRWSPCR